MPSFAGIAVANVTGLWQDGAQLVWTRTGWCQVMVTGNPVIASRDASRLLCSCDGLSLDSLP
jgi:hypothetical protein